MNLLCQLVAEDRGQDLTEYTLLIAFLVVASAAIYFLNMDSVAGIWSVTNSNLDAAKSAAS